MTFIISFHQLNCNTVPECFSSLLKQISVFVTLFLTYSSGLLNILSIRPIECSTKLTFNDQILQCSMISWLPKDCTLTLVEKDTISISADHDYKEQHHSFFFTYLWWAESWMRPHWLSPSWLILLSLWRKKDDVRVHRLSEDMQVTDIAGPCCLFTVKLVYDIIPGWYHPVMTEASTEAHTVNFYCHF